MDWQSHYNRRSARMRTHSTNGHGGQVHIKYSRFDTPWSGKYCVHAWSGLGKAVSTKQNITMFLVKYLHASLGTVSVTTSKSLLVGSQVSTPLYGSMVLYAVSGIHPSRLLPEIHPLHLYPCCISYRVIRLNITRTHQLIWYRSVPTFTWKGSVQGLRCSVASVPEWFAE
jgi:hypothetical protein